MGKRTAALLIGLAGTVCACTSAKKATISSSSTTAAPTASTTTPSISGATVPAISGTEVTTAFARLKSQAAITAFKRAGLDVGASRPMTVDDYGLAPHRADEGTRFFIASLGPDSGGRVMSFSSQADLDATKAYYDDLGKSSAAFFSWTFAHENLLVQINGELPEPAARKYEAALDSI